MQTLLPPQDEELSSSESSNEDIIVDQSIVVTTTQDPPPLINESNALEIIRPSSFMNDQNIIESPINTLITNIPTTVISTIPLSSIPKNTSPDQTMFTVTLHSPTLQTTQIPLEMETNINPAQPSIIQTSQPNSSQASSTIISMPLPASSQSQITDHSPNMKSAMEVDDDQKIQTSENSIRINSLLLQFMTENESQNLMNINDNHIFFNKDPENNIQPNNYPWNESNVDISDWFNYGFDEHSWREYCSSQLKIRSILTQKKVATAQANIILKNQRYRSSNRFNTNAITAHLLNKNILLPSIVNTNANAVQSQLIPHIIQHPSVQNTSSTTTAVTNNEKIEEKQNERLTEKTEMEVENRDMPTVPSHIPKKTSSTIVDNTNVPNADRIRGICFEFRNKGFCHRGRNCRWKHLILDEKGNIKQLNITNDNDRQRGICFDYQNKGYCSWGTSCRWKHMKGSTTDNSRERDRYMPLPTSSSMNASSIRPTITRNHTLNDTSSAVSKLLGQNVLSVSSLAAVAGLQTNSMRMQQSSVPMVNIDDRNITTHLHHKLTKLLGETPNIPAVVANLLTVEKSGGQVGSGLGNLSTSSSAMNAAMIAMANMQKSGRYSGVSSVRSKRHHRKRRSERSSGGERERRRKRKKRDSHGSDDYERSAEDIDDRSRSRSRSYSDINRSGSDDVMGKNEVSKVEESDDDDSSVK